MISFFNSKYQSNNLVSVMPCRISNNDKMHKHNYFEAVYIRDGRAEHILNEERIKVSAGDFFIIDYDTKHMLEVEMEKSRLKRTNPRPRNATEGLIKTYSEQTALGCAERSLIIQYKLCRNKSCLDPAGK